MKKKPKLKANHKIFADHYLKHGNAAEAARESGTKSKNPARIGYEYLQRPDIKEYVAIKRIEIEDQQDDELVADVNEISAFLTSTMRDGQVKRCDRLRSAEILAKIKGVFDKKTEEDSSTIEIDVEIVEEDED